MRSAAQSEASRTNGHQSQGPATAEGKAASARNSFRHGFTAAKQLILSGETQDEFDALLDSLATELDPATEVEENLVEEMAIAKWRLNRIRRAQEQLLAQGDFLTALDDPEKDRKLRMLSRYEKDYNRQYRAAYRLLLDHRTRQAESRKADSQHFQQMMLAHVASPTPGELRSRNEPGAAPKPPAQTAATPSRFPFFRRS